MNIRFVLYRHDFHGLVVTIPWPESVIFMAWYSHFHGLVMAAIRLLYFSLAYPRRFFIRATSQEEGGNEPRHLAHAMVHAVGHPPVPIHTGTRGTQGGVGRQEGKARDLVDGRLLQPDDGLQRRTFVLVARRLSAPRGTIDPGLPLP